MEGTWTGPIWLWKNQQAKQKPKVVDVVEVVIYCKLFGTLFKLQHFGALTLLVGCCVTGRADGL